jgi:serine/threonine protein kinase
VNVGNSLRKTFCGTPLYVSLEILKGEEYNEKTDFWALGVILFEMLFGEDPFQIKRESELVKIVDCEFKLPVNVKISKDAHHLLMNCLQTLPTSFFTLSSNPFNPKYDIYP